MKKAPAILTALLTLVSPGFAHHSMSAEFDVAKSVTIKGTICSGDFSNPHSYLYVHVKLSNGQAETWKLELPGFARLKTQGVPKEDFKPGDAVTIEAYPSKTSSTTTSSPGLIYSGCQANPANSLRTGHVREATFSSGKGLQISDTWPETITIRQ